jgi:predicted nucleic acid-binding protein
LIAADTSSLIAYLQGLDGEDISAIDRAMGADLLRIPPPAATELLTAGSPPVDQLLTNVPFVKIDIGFWERAGRSRSLLRTKGLTARLGDSLIAQCCIDVGIALITRDIDFRHFEQWCGLKLAT